FSELRREALECERWNLLHPGEEPRTPYVRQMLKGREGPVIAATDYMRTVPDQIRQWVEGRYVTLGTDGFGRSDSRAALRRHFEVDRNYIAVAALKALADESRVDRATVEKAIKALGIDPVRANGSVPPAAAPASPPAAGGVARVGAATQATATPANTPPSRTAAAPPPAARGVSPAAAPERASAPEAGAAPAAAVATTLRSDLAPIDEPGFSRAHAGPSVRKFARELGVDLARVIGHGFKGRITHEDVKSFVKSALAGGAPETARPAAPALPPFPAVDFTQFGPTAIEPLSRIQRISGPRLHASWVNVSHVTQFDLADITELEQVRAGLKDRAQAAGVKLTPLAFILRACVKALQQFPRFNASLDAAGANLIVRKFLHLGFAADTPNGLVVPVVRDEDRKDVY